jgi:asparagine synthase (glutamine-hydrolysing)
MGALDIIIYNNQNIGIDFVRGFMKMKHRGIDNSSYYSESSVSINSLNQMDYNKVSYVLSRSQITNYIQYTFIYGHHRMAITDDTYDAIQPFVDPIQNMIMTYKELRTRPIRKLVCNGEIYNYRTLVSEFNFSEKDLQSSCDVEIILPLYIKNSEELDSAEEGLVKTISQLNGDFAFVITENVNTYVTKTINAFAVRDFIGIKPLYYIYNSNNTFWMFVSEIKSIPYFIINNSNYTIMQVPPGTYWSFQNIINGGEHFTKYYDLQDYAHIDSCNVNVTNAETLVDIYENIRTLLTNSTVIRCTNTVKEVGFLLSGGFDSSILVSIIAQNINYVDKKLHLFSIGDSLGSDGLDIDHAKAFVEFLEATFVDIKIEHHVIYVNDIEILSSDIENIIYHLESYDPETIRESIPFYYLFKYISEHTNVKVLISGDGLDDLCGYAEYEDYEDAEFQKMSVKVLSNIHLYDILRTDRISQAFSLEIRHPYLDKAFVEYILCLHPKIKRSQVYKNTEEPIEKYIVRKSFDSSLGFNYLPEHITWRRSVCICNCLTNFELRLSNYFDEKMTMVDYNNNLSILMETPGTNTLTLPKTKEEMYYRNIFDKLYPNRSYLVPLFWGDQFSYCV